MKKNRWLNSNTAVYNIGFHIIWCPKYRRRILKGNIEKRLKELLLLKAKEMSIVIEKMEIMPDHLHLFVKCAPTDTPCSIVRLLKGYTSRVLRIEFPLLKYKLPTLWTRSYYCESIGHISENTIIKYIEGQKLK